MLEPRFRYDARMRWGWLFLVVGLLGACTKPNTAKQCNDGTCTTPAFPFCDMTGFVSGEPGTCIAVTCTPSTFGECRGDKEVRCNAEGTNYDIVQCERGCDAAADGCRLCDPNETACTNGKVATCDASGAIVSSTSCPLGCYEAEPRCRNIDPSNGLAMFLDMFPAAPAVNLVNAEIDTATGDIRDNGVLLTVPNVLVPAPPNGVPIRVFVVDSARLQSVTTYESSRSATGPALAFVARNDIVVTGPVKVFGDAGGTTDPSCMGGVGVMSRACAFVSAAGGGGGNATAGARGGSIAGSTYPGGTGGAAGGSETLVPLRGGCAGGSSSDEFGPYLEFGGPGGGALQLTSNTNIVVNGVIDVRGQTGASEEYGQMEGYAVFGGGAGGGILLEAPLVQLETNAKLLATGGNGWSCPNPTNRCGYGGNGASPGVASTPGEDIGTCTNTTHTYSGGGGGGLGRLRVNTKTGTYTKSNTAVEAASVSAGTVSTR